MKIGRERPGAASDNLGTNLALPALGMAGLLVFVDAMKELPATVLLRPFNFETLATYVYSFALPAALTLRLAARE
jgi:iron(III) transport system permease protein